MMTKYFLSQIKRISKLLPFAFAMVTVFFLSLFIIYSGFKVAVENDERRLSFKIGVTGDLDHEYFDLALTALKTVDVSRFLLEVYPLEEDEASRRVESGEISSYIVIPEGFIDSLKKGEIPTIQYVSSGSETGMGPLFRDEITKIVEEVVFSSQKGIFAAENLLREKGHKKLASRIGNRMNIEYITLFLSRDGFYKANSLEQFSNITFSEKFACGILTLFLFLSSTVFSLVLARGDLSLARVLSARSVTPARQTVCEYTAYFLSCVLVQFPFVAGALIFLQNTHTVESVLLTVVSVLAQVALACGLNLLLFEFSGNVVSGVLLQFFVTMSISYISGCFYPINSLPDVLQKVSAVLPTGIIRQAFEDCVSQEVSFASIANSFVLTLVFVGVVSALRRYKIVKKS